MNKEYETFERFKAALVSGAGKVFLAGSEERYCVYYVPFEYVNVEARLVLVGITPGPKQVDCSYKTARSLLETSMSHTHILREIKRSCAFVGMRDRINEMLDHFRIPNCIGIASAASLWNEGFRYFLPTSIVPNAAFKSNEPFNGPFSAVLQCDVLRHQFEHMFVPSIRGLSQDALYIGMGPVVDEAFRWCVSRGILNGRQILGYFPHASGSSGSQFDYFMRRKRLPDLKPNDPVRYRANNLDAAYENIRSKLRSLFPGYIEA